MTTNDCIHSESHDGFAVEIHPDYPEYGCNGPREFDNLSVLVLLHGRYELPNEIGLRDSDYGSWAEVRDALVNEHGALHILPVYMIDHSGLSFRAGRDFGDCDPGHWDSGMVGFVFATAETIENCGTPEDLIDQVLVSDVDDYDHWQSGGWVGWVVRSPEGDVLESCWGYSSEEDALEEARPMARYYVEQRAEQANALAADAMADTLVHAGVIA